MTRDEVRKLADLAGWTPTALAMATEAEWARREAFAGLIHGYVVQEEREACAQLMEGQHIWITNISAGALIRARSKA